jgi:signal transduction histidine kinase
MAAALRLGTANRNYARVPSVHLFKDLPSSQMPVSLWRLPNHWELPRMQRAVSSNRSVLAGFLGLLGLMGCIAVDAALQIRDVSAKSATLRKEARNREALLDQMSNDIYRSATLVRDYMLEDDESLAASQKAELQLLRPRVEQSLSHYGENAPQGEKDAIQSLQRYSESYWRALAPALDWTPGVRRKQAESFLRNTIFPRRQEVFQFMKQIDVLNKRTLDAEDDQIEVAQAQFQSRVGWISVVAIALGGILAIVVVRHVQHLGVEAATRFNEVLAAREDLTRLSERLVNVQEEERRNLSRELHDDLGQTMSAMLIELGKLESARACPGNYSDGWASVRHLAEQNVAKVRDMALLLRPAMLDELGLVPALRWQGREVSRRTGLKVKMIADELNEHLPDSKRTCIYRVVQEALNNCVKHSKAKEVRVVIHRDADGLSVSVQDDGLGFDPAHNKGLGLLGMMERVSGLGGRFHIESQPGRGTIVSTYFPLEEGHTKPLGESLV